MAPSRACLHLPIRPLLPTRTRLCSTRRPRVFCPLIIGQRWQGTSPTGVRFDDDITSHDKPSDLSHLNPAPEDYSRFIFQDKCHVTVHAGAGGHGCVSYLREKYVEEGPPNGGDGGSGGGIYIQAVEGLTSLHKLARRGIIKASRGRNGQGKSKGGKRGDDVLLQVPVGTVVREVERHDPVAEEIARRRKPKEAPADEDEIEFTPIRHDRWVLHPGANPSDFLTVAFPRLKPRRQGIAAMEPKAPIYLDLSKPMDKPMLLAAGGAGGLGNPHFVTRSMGRPKFASRGEGGMRLELDFELKLLADVGLVGKPNAGKSTLLRSLTNSRTRIGNWEFTTLSPHIGTVIVDDNKGRPLIESKGKTRRTHFTIADIPGLVEDAHLDRGLGLGFLRHIDRAGILAFVLDLSAGDPVQEVQKLWHELGEYERVRNTDPEPVIRETQGVIDWDPSGAGLPELDRPQKRQIELESPDDRETGHTLDYRSSGSLPPLTMPPIHTKPWFVVATKADLENTQDQYRALQEYLSAVENGSVEHPSGHVDGWREKVTAVPVSAIRGEGVSRIPKLVMQYLE
ncbi:GTPase Obg [Penicillium canariense]|uniref:GTPase Obg n=1 Tax=Penicillium canariense TaxID=189055 RepID=A0A9W9I5E2_9EURO|nr:GTPase Obg [Penicillium canariense]KAJ5167356.1 GTPase Obg [Penicillium canariense]